MTRDRGQLVVLAAAALAIALVPMALAYLQLGYHEDVQTATVDTDTLPDVERSLHRALVSESSDLPARYAWSNRSGAVTRLRDRLRPTIESLTDSRLESGTALTISYNDSRALRWADTACPSGPGRDFGTCRADRGVVVQERVGRAHALAVAVDVTVTRPDGTASATFVLSGPTVSDRV